MSPNVSNDGSLWIFIISAPSGAGKTTLSHAVLGQFKQMERVVTTTTRPRRPNEIPGSSYHFVSLDEFKKMIARDEFYEYAEVHGNFYGNSKKAVEDIFKRGHHCLLIIDVQGGRTIKQKYKNTRLIFVEPPSLEELERRIRKRGLDDEPTIRKRLENARKEMAHKGDYDVVIVNDDFDRTCDELQRIIERTLSARGH